MNPQTLTYNDLIESLMEKFDIKSLTTEYYKILQNKNMKNNEKVIIKIKLENWFITHKFEKVIIYHLLYIKKYYKTMNRLNKEIFIF